MYTSWNNGMFAGSAVVFIEENKLVPKFISIYKDEIDAFRERAAEDADNALSREQFVDEYLSEIVDFFNNDMEIIEVMAETIKSFDEGVLVRYDKNDDGYIIDFISFKPHTKGEVLSLYATVMKRATELGIEEIELKKYVMQGMLNATD